jgi:hypothetical protein
MIYENRVDGKYWNRWKDVYRYHAKTPAGGPSPEDVHSSTGFLRVTLDGVPYWGFTREEERDAFVQTYGAEIVL